MTMTFDASSGRSANCTGHIARQNREPDPGGPDFSQGQQGFNKAPRKFANPPDSLLTKVIEGEIIPRLLMAHRGLGAPVLRESAALANDHLLINSEAFARLVLDSEAEDIVLHVQSLLDQGVPLERVFLDLLAPVARKLGEMWEEDYCTFTEVTLGLSRLHRVLHDIGRSHGAVLRRSLHRRAFFAPVPGEQHTFGVSMLEEFFRNAGWETLSDHAPSTLSILQIAATQSLDVIGFSVGCQELLDPLSELIGATREASCNRDVAIMVGGGLFIDNRHLAARFGNATIVTDGVNAVQVAEEMVARVRHTREAEQIA